MSRSSDQETMYDLSNVLEFDALSQVRPGSNILLSGPSMTGKQDLAYAFLADGSERGEGAVIVTTSDRAESVIDDYRTRVTDFEPSMIGIVDCRGEGSRTSDRTDEGVFVQRVSSPSDLTGIGIGITKCLETLNNNGAERGRFALVSLSTMLTYTDRKTVFKFCHVLSSRFDSVGYLGLFTIDSGAHDDQTIQVIKQAFDGMIQIRETDSGRDVRVMGLSGSPSEWREL